MVATKENEIRCQAVEDFVLLSCLALSDIGFGPTRINRYLDALMKESDIATEKDDTSAYIESWKRILRNRGVKAFPESEDCNV